ncbi:Ribosomal protein L21 [Macleaya cordata]|uniref:Large ribosomal subunit protein bL21m n=1 Tax=Macleaya cordata TaxID=56857 RepID=A0A200QWR7_MACCD|nr:Ribosomal protein L21 [Macleaya cordata]
MASKRCLNTLTRHCPFLFSSNAPFQSIITKSPLHTLAVIDHLPLETPNTSNPPHFHHKSGLLCCIQSKSVRNFSSRRRYPGKEGDEEEEEEDEGEGEDEDEDEDEEEEGELSEESDEEEIHNGVSVSNRTVNRTYSLEEKETEAAEIGYKVIGPLDPSERPFTAWEPLFAVVQIGSHQFKVSNGDSIYTERLKFCEVNDKLILSKVLMVGSKSQTIIGRPILPDAAVHAVVEEHALDAKVIIFKKKRRKNYRRTKGHRQPVKPEKPEKKRKEKTEKQGIENPEKEAVAA